MVVSTLLLAAFTVPAVAASAIQDDTLSYVLVQAKVRDAETRKPVPFVTVVLQQSDIATVTNTDGDFTLKIPKNIPGLKIDFSCMGYNNLTVDVAQLPSVVSLWPSDNKLQEVIVRPTEPATMIKTALERIPQNYGQSPVAMTSFYREFIKRNSNYIGIAEAVFDIYKASYTTMQSDRARIYKGRKSVDTDKIDTLLIKYQGGATTMLWLDLVKNRHDGLFNEDFLSYYTFNYDGVEMIDDKPHYVISFNQRPEIQDPLYRGRIYIDPRTLAIARVAFNMNVEGRKDVQHIFIKRAPRGFKVTPQSAEYVVNYREKDRRWYYHYSRVEVKFKTNWKRFLFFTPTITIISEMAITDMETVNVKPFAYKEAIRKNDIIADKLSVFTGDSFWENYNYIEPEQSIDNAIKRMNKKLRRQGMQLDTENE